MPENMAYMACHFSPGGTRLSNLPQTLPSGALLILDDSMPMDGHDAQLIASQLTLLHHCHRFDALLLDFQRADIPEQQALAAVLAHAFPFPVGVSDLYAGDLACPIFLPPVPPDKLLSEYLSPWQGREIWLEAALDGVTLTLTEAGCSAAPLFDFPGDGLSDETRHCHYSIETDADSAVFRLWRTTPDLDALLTEAETLGVTQAIGLWQELVH